MEFPYADGSFAKEIGDTFKEIYQNKQDKEAIMKISYQFREAFTMFDLYGINNENIYKNAHIICIAEGGGAVIMRKRPPRKDLLENSVNKLKNGTIIVTQEENEDFDVYKSAEAIVDELEVNKPAIILLTSDVANKLDMEDLSVLIVVRDDISTNVLIVDPLVSLQYKMGDTTLPSMAHRRFASPDFQLRKSMVEALFYNVYPKNISVVPMKILGTIFQTRFSNRHFPIFIAMLLDKLFKLPPTDSVATIKTALLREYEDEITTEILDSILV